MKNTSNEAHFFDKVAGSGSRSDLLLCIKILRYFKNVYFPEKPFGYGF